MEETLKAYIAGLFDGDGSVFIRKQKYGREDKSTFILEVAFAMQSKETLDMLVQTFGGKVVGGPSRPWHRAYDYKRSGVNAVAILSVIRPYVLTKKKAVEFAFFVYEHILSVRGRGQHHIPPREYEIRELCHAIMSLLNHADTMHFQGKSGEFSETLSSLFKDMATLIQASEGKGSEEGATTTEVSPNNNPLQERPTSVH